MRSCISKTCIFAPQRAFARDRWVWAMMKQVLYRWMKIHLPRNYFELCCVHWLSWLRCLAWMVVLCSGLCKWLGFGVWVWLGCMLRMALQWLCSALGVLCASPRSGREVRFPLFVKFALHAASRERHANIWLFNSLQKKIALFSTNFLNTPVADERTKAQTNE